MLPAVSHLWDAANMAEAEELRGPALYRAMMAIKPTELAETDWAVKAGVNRAFFTNLKSSDISPRMDTLQKLLGHVGKTHAELHAAGQPTRLPDEAGHRGDRSEQPAAHSADLGETVEIVRLDLSLPMGPGATVDDYVEEEPLAFDLAYLRSFTRTPPHRLRLAGGAGDSMFPTLVSNDLVWIDTTQNELRHSDRIYAASINGGAAIKRLRPVAGGKRILVVSDNKTVEPYEVDAEDVRIWGRVIRFARDL